jgi:hypothetical protein
MRRPVISAAVLTGLLMAAPARAQSPASPSATPIPGDGLAVGGFLMPAINGGAWFSPGVRVSAPLGRRLRLDVDAAPVFGGTNRVVSIRSFLAAQLRTPIRSRDEAGNGRYWLAGLRYLPMEKLREDGSVREEKSATLLTGGVGWDQVFRNRLRAAVEVGLSAGDGLMPFASLTVQIPLTRR